MRGLEVISEHQRMSLCIVTPGLQRASRFSHNCSLPLTVRASSTSIITWTTQKRRSASRTRQRYRARTSRAQHLRRQTAGDSDPLAYADACTPGQVSEQRRPAAAPTVCPYVPLKTPRSVIAVRFLENVVLQGQKFHPE